MAKIDSGLGWKVDEDYYIYEADTLIDEDDYGRKKYDGAAIIAVVFEGENTQGRPVMISTVENNCLNTQAMTAYSSIVGGVTWYGTRQNTLLRENEIIVGAKVTVAEGINPYYFPDDADVRATIISTILTQAGVEYTPKVTTTDYVKGYVEGVEAETAARVNANKTNIGTLSNLKTTAKTDLVSAINELKGTVYTFHIDPDEADSYEAVTYHDDAVGMTPAAMGATTFNYGSWAAFINKICRPCMLKFDGTVDYYLDPNDYSKKLDGTASDVADLSYPGNAMVEFPLIWWKSWGDGWVSIADYQVDATYKCWSNLDADGNIIPYFYLPIYNGCIYDGKMRSISGIQLKPWSTTAYSSSTTYAVGDEVNHDSRMWKCITAVETPEDFDSTKWEQFAFNANTTGTKEITYATANNVHNKQEWYTDVFCDRGLINALLVLISKSIDTQGAFGIGIDIGSQVAKEAYITGSLNNKGLFYGSTSNGNTAVKVFGMENWWACVWRRTAGLIGGDNNTYLYKMTASTTDGSSANGYNTDGTGYLSINGRPSEDSWIKKMQHGTFGMLPLEVGSYNTQYYKDNYWSGTGYAIVGGTSADGSYCGAFCLSTGAGVNSRWWNMGASLSCKPCLIKEAIVNE